MGGGWQGQNVFPLLIVTSAGPFQGFFAYVTRPAAGNLIASVTAGGGTDPYGNVYLQGVSQYTGGASPTAINMAAGQVTWQTAATEAGPWTIQALIQLSGTNGLQLGTAAFPGLISLEGATSRVNVASADLDITVAGFGLRVKEGANSRLGTATLVGGTVTVANTTVGVSTRVLYARSVAGGTLGFLSRTISAGVSFTINSSSNLDTSQIAWMLVEPG